MNDQPITITRISAQNVYCFDALLEISLEDVKLLLIKGDNNVGKTSVLRLLSLIVQGTDSPRAVVTDGHTKGYGELTLSNGYKLRRTVTSSGENGHQYFKVFDERDHEVPGGQTFVNKWLGELPDFNPLAWLNLATSDKAADRKRAQSILLQAVRVTLTPADFTAATNSEPPTSIDFSGHGLEVLETLRAHYATERAISNRDADTKKKATLEARAKLPSERPVITDARRSEVDGAIADAKQARQSIEIRRAAASSHQQAVDQIERAKEREAEARAQLSREVGELEAEIAAIEQKIVRRREQFEASAARSKELDCELTGLASSAPPTDAEIEAANVLVRKANALATSLAEDDKLLARFAEVESMEEEATGLAAQASIVGSTVGIIDNDLRARLMAKAQLPVSSLAIDGDQILIDGHPINQIAESQQIRVAVSIARSLAPTLRQIALDGAERLSTQTLLRFLEEIHGDGFKYVATQVDPDGGPMQFVVFGETADAVVQQTKAVA